MISSENERKANEPRRAETKIPVVAQRADRQQRHGHQHRCAAQRN
jgi:hypothetical protein